MNLQYLEDLQNYLLGSHQRSGKYGRPMLADMNRPSLYREPIVDRMNVSKYRETLAHTFVLAHYIQHRYETDDFAAGYRQQDQSLIQLLSDIQDRLKGLAEKTKAKFQSERSEWSDFEQMLDQPANFYSRVPRYEEAKQILDSLVRFRQTYSVPFHQLNPENIRELFWLYDAVATMNHKKLTAQDREEVQWLIWATEDFHPFTTSSQIQEAKGRKEAIQEMYYRARAFLKLVQEDPQQRFTHSNLPPEVQKIFTSCEQAVQIFCANMENVGLVPLSIQKDRIDKAISQLTEPKQPTLFPLPPSSHDGPGSFITNLRDRTR